MDLIAPDINCTAVRFPRGRSTKVINGIISALPHRRVVQLLYGPGWELHMSFSLVEVLMPWPIHYPHIDVSPTSGPPTSTPMFDPPGGKAIPHKDSTLLKVHGESLCRWNNLHRAHVCDFFNFSIRTTNRSLAGHWLGKCTSHAAKRPSLNPSIDLLLSPSAHALCPYLPNKKAPAEFQMCLLPAPSPSHLQQIRDGTNPLLPRRYLPDSPTSTSQVYHWI
jgi:hypothetical protein